MSNGTYDFHCCRQQFLRHLERMDYSGETSRGYQKDLEFFERLIKKRKGEDKVQVDDIVKDDLLAFMDHGRAMGHAPNTIARRLSTIKSFYKFLVNELDYPVDIAARIKLPKTFVPLRDILTESEIQRLLEYVSTKDARFHLLFSILYYTGSRLTPVRTLERNHVLLQERIIYFPKVKGGKDLYLPIHDQLMDLLSEYFRISWSERAPHLFPSKRFPSQPISAAHIRQKLKLFSQGAGIKKHITPHSIRHATATHLTIKKVDQRVIASILGHSDLRSTMRYQHLAIEHLRDPINVL